MVLLRIARSVPSGVLGLDVLEGAHTDQSLELAAQHRDESIAAIAHVVELEDLLLLLSGNVHGRRDQVHETLEVELRNQLRSAELPVGDELGEAREQPGQMVAAPYHLERFVVPGT